MTKRIEHATRTEYGYQRTTCGCHTCVTNCRFMPGFLIPSDIERLCPAVTETSVDVPGLVEWATETLLASEGALVQRTDGTRFHIRTIVMASKPDGTCKQLTSGGLCQVHAAAPFGCAFFDCDLDNPRMELSKRALMDLAGLSPQSLYVQLWDMLWSLGLRAEPLVVRRGKMDAYLKERGM